VSGSISVRVAVPTCSLRKPYAREFHETERLPPPSTVYGCLLSLVGEEDRYTYIGTRLALAVTKQPAVSLVLRTIWHTKDKKLPRGTGRNKRPDYQEVLTGLEIAIWVREGLLAGRLRAAQKNADLIKRFGGLCLGESRDLVDEVSFDPQWTPSRGRWLFREPRGQYPLPVWVDHVGSKATHWQQFSIMDAPLTEPPSGDPRWITIEPRRDT